jgi:hypothetical protein
VPDLRRSLALATYLADWGFLWSEQMFDVIIPASELQNLPDFKLYIRTLFRGWPQEPFLVQSFPPFTKNGKETTAEQVIRTSGARFGRDRLTVEKTVERFLAQGSVSSKNTWRLAA